MRTFTDFASIRAAVKKTATRVELSGHPQDQVHKLLMMLTAMGVPSFQLNIRIASELSDPFNLHMAFGILQVVAS